MQSLVFHIQAIYEKLKASLDPKMGSSVMEPTVYPIDWTHNPICRGTQGKPNVDTAVDAEQQGSETDNCSAPELSLENMNLKDNATDEQPEGKLEEGNRSSFDKLVECAPYDYVLLTDCVFSAELAVPLVNTILCCCGPRTNVICCHEIRDEVYLYYRNY